MRRSDSQALAGDARAELEGILAKIGREKNKGARCARDRAVALFRCIDVCVTPPTLVEQVNIDVSVMPAARQTENIAWPDRALT